MNALQPMLSKFLSGFREDGGVISARDIWTVLDVPVNRRSQCLAEMGRAMKDLGWQKAKRRLAKGAYPVNCYIYGNGVRRIVAHSEFGQENLPPRLRYMDDVPSDDRAPDDE